MNKLSIKGLYALTACSVLTFGLAQTSYAVTCSTSSIWASNVTPALGGANVLTANVDATACAGGFTGNENPYPGTKGGLNLGYFGDGLVNGAAQGGSGNTGGFPLFPNGMFSSLYPNQDLNGDGISDPGWIHAGGVGTDGVFDAGVPVGGAITITPGTFSFHVNADGKTGTWSISPELANAVALESLLKGNLLDQFAIVVKYGDNFQAFDFTASSLGLALTTPPVLYDFAGGFDMSFMAGQGAGFSHADLYFRDPVQATDVPEPSSLALLGLGLLGLSFFRRKRQ